MKTWIRRFASSVLVSTIAASVSLSPGATGATTDKLSLYHIGPDSFWTYDFTEQTVSSSGVDWPVNLLFYKNAHMFKIDDRMPEYDQSGSEMHNQVDDGDGAKWASDGGKKKTKCPFTGSTPHFRRYRNPDKQSSYNRSFGFYIIATSHIDAHECTRWRWFGKSEKAEEAIAKDARRDFGSDAVQEDRWPLGNEEPYREEGDHIWQNSGDGTTIRVD